MIIRRHAVGISCQFVSQTVVADVHENVNIVAPDRFPDNSFGFTGTETGYGGFDQVGVAFITIEGDGGSVGMLTFFPPFYQIFVDLFSGLGKAVHGDDSQAADGKRFQLFDVIPFHY